LTLKKKILIGYGIAFAFMGIVVTWAIINLVSLGNATDAILSENYRSIIAAENMMAALERQDSGTLLLFLGDVEKGAAQFLENEAVFLEWLARAKDNITIDGEAELVQSIKSDYTAYSRQFSALADLVVTAEPPLRPSYYQDTIYPLFNKVREACVSLRNLNEETLYTARSKAGIMVKHDIWSTSVVAVLALIVTLIFSLILSERITSPIRSFMEAARKISSGDFSVKVPVETGDELGSLAGEFNQMVVQLHRYNEMNIEQIVSEKNKAEAILSSIEDGMVIFDTSLMVTGINPAASRILGLDLTDTISLQCDDIFPGTNVNDMIRKTVETGVQPCIPDENRIITLPEAESSRHYLFSVTAVRGKDHKLSGSVLLLKDVTRLQEVERLKREFVMAASHELRTPLTSLGMSVDLLLENGAKGLDEKDRELLQAAHEEVHRMKALVNDLLDLSKLEAGKFALEIESVPVQTLFDQMRTFFKSQMEMKEIRLTSELDDDMPMVRADVNKISRVLINLISNALRYVNKGGHIELVAHWVDPHIHISVRDDGPGIPPEYQSRIFQKFVQVKGQEAGGTGLGLAICREIVRAHGGAIWLDSSSKQGSTFTFNLPVVL
jgi:two-component system, NtrC family, sensor histidine kinase KinB